MLNAADMFQIEDIQNACLKYYTSVVHDNNCLEFKETADLRAITTLSEICLNYALQRFLLVDVSYNVYVENVGHGLKFSKKCDKCFKSRFNMNNCKCHK